MTAFNKAWAVLKYRNPYNKPVQNTPDENIQDEPSYFRSTSTRSALADVHGDWDGVNREQKLNEKGTNTMTLPGGYPGGTAPEFNPFHPIYRFNPLRFPRPLESTPTIDGLVQEPEAGETKTQRAGMRVKAGQEVDPRIARYATIDPKPGQLTSLPRSKEWIENDPFYTVPLPNLRRVQGEDERVAEAARGAGLTSWRSLQ